MPEWKLLRSEPVLQSPWLVVKKLTRSAASGEPYRSFSLPPAATTNVSNVSPSRQSRSVRPADGGPQMALPSMVSAAKRRRSTAWWMARRTDQAGGVHSFQKQAVGA